MSHAESSIAGRAASRRIPRIAVAIPVLVLAGWFSYMWYVSGVLPSVEKDPASGKITAEGYVKRVGWGDYRRHGHWVTYHANGRKASEGMYRLGELDGEWSYWNDAGENTPMPSTAKHARVP